MSLVFKIPHDLEEAIAWLIRDFNDIEREEFKRDDPDSYHHGLGTSLRNTWGLWSGSGLADWFIERGINHADDMSGIILTSLHRRLLGDEIDFEGQVAECQEYWKKNA